MTTELDPAGLGIPKRYGARENYEGSQGRAAGVSGTRRQGVLEFNGDQPSFRTLTLPKGAIVTKTIAVTAEAGAMTGTDPTIVVGVEGTEATNTAIELTEAQAEARGAYVEGTPSGTLALPTTEDLELAVVLGGTSPTLAGGKYRVFIEYEYAGDLDGL